MASLETLSDGRSLFPFSQQAATAATIHLGVTTPLLVVALTIFGARIWLRSTPTWRIDEKDYIMAIGVAMAIVDFAFLIPQLHTNPKLLGEDELSGGRKYAYISAPIWSIAMTLMKASITLKLLSIRPNSVWWRVLCAFLVAVQAVYAIGNTLYGFLQCHPLEAAWDLSLQAEGTPHCLSPAAFRIASKIGSGINISTTIVISIVPIMLLSKHGLPSREKLLVGFLILLGMIASFASIYRLILMGKYGTVDDIWKLEITIGTWSIVEQSLVMIIASAPFLKPPMKIPLRSTGQSPESSRRGGLRSRENATQAPVPITEIRATKRVTVRSSRPELNTEEDDLYVAPGETVIPLSTMRPDRRLRGLTVTTVEARGSRALSEESPMEGSDFSPTQGPREEV